MGDSQGYEGVSMIIAPRLRAIANEMRPKQPAQANDLESAATEIERLHRKIDELEGFINGIEINCRAIVRKIP